MILAEKPVRVSKGTPVLRANKRYRFTGRLTCVINGRRVSAPKRARIDLLNTIGKKTSEKSGTTVASKGAFQIILAYPSSRTADLPLHQQRRSALAGHGSGSSCEKKKSKR